MGHRSRNHLTEWAELVGDSLPEGVRDEECAPEDRVRDAAEERGR